MIAMIKKEFINEWKKTDFSTYNEADVRENFIAPLLKLLGYGKNTVNDVLTEQSLKLKEPFLKIGRKSIRIDYMPTIRLKSFWIIEAKPGYAELEIGDFLQAYFYAIHPEVQVQYIVLCNGKRIDVYDINYNEGWGKPFFSIDQAGCEEKFEELIQILSANSMLQSIRERIISQIQNSFEVELNIDQFSYFRMKLQSIMEEVKKKIEGNEKKMIMDVMKEQERKYQEYLKNADSKELIRSMKWADRRTASLYMAYYKLIENAEPEERAKLLEELMQHYYSRTLGEFKVDCLGIFLEVVKNKLEIEHFSMWSDPKKTLADIIIGNLTYHRDSELLNALAYLDRACHKFAYHAIRNEILMEGLTQQIFDLKKHMSKEDEIRTNPSVTIEMTRLIFAYLNILWSTLSGEDSVEKIWRHVIILNRLNEKPAQIPKYPDNNEDLLWYESFGDNFDYLCRVSCLLLENEKEIINKIGIEKDIVEKLYNCSTLDYSSMIPKVPELEIEVTSSDMDNTVTKIMMAMAKTFKLYEDIKREGLN